MTFPASDPRAVGSLAPNEEAAFQAWLTGAYPGFSDVAVALARQAYAAGRIGYLTAEIRAQFPELTTLDQYRELTLRLYGVRV